MNLRLFCALQTPPTVRDELGILVDSLRASLSATDISWVRPANYHLTLSFLGDVAEERVPQLVADLQEASKGFGPFELVCEQLGCFPNLDRPRVIWAGAASEGAELAQLQDRVALACAPFAERQETSSFHGHITLGRVRLGVKLTREKLAHEIEQYRNTVFGRWYVTGLELICSDLSQGAPRYSVLHDVPFS